MVDELAAEPEVPDERDNVIHVSFGDKRLREPVRSSQTREKSNASDPVHSLYSRKDVAKLFSCSEGRLRYWDQTGFVAPSVRDGRRSFYTFEDLISIRAVKGLVDNGVPLRRVRRSVEALRRVLPRVFRPLAQLRVQADGSSLVVRDDGGSYEPSTGQRVLDFRVESLREDVVKLFNPKLPGEKQRQAAYEAYLEGCRLDEDESTYDRAEDAYQRALRLDPSLANAFTNLGNLRFRRGADEAAEQFYSQALAVDPKQPEALYNLGFLFYERGEVKDAASYFHRALEQDPSFADAHFNLAMAYEDLGERHKAKAHWELYLELDPAGSWAEIARRHLD